MSIDVDLRVDLNTEDNTGLPWAFVRDARDPAVLEEGAWLVVGSGSARVVAQVVQIDGELVWVRPLPGPVSQHRELVGVAAQTELRHHRSISSRRAYSNCPWLTAIDRCVPLRADPSKRLLRPLLPTRITGV